MRKYDVSLVNAIRSKQYVKTIDGLDVTMKPVPDDDRENVLDPRILEIVINKKKMFAEKAKTKGGISKERYRPDKVTYDLTTKEIDIDERLIPVRNHMIDIFIHRPADAKGKLPVLVYLHGGGWTAGDHKLYSRQLDLVSELANCVCVFPEYRLSPECPYPGPVNDCYGTVEWVAAHAEELEIDTEKLMVAGDSAGGQLSTACVYRDEKGLIKRCFLIYPAVDLAHPDDSPYYRWSYDAYPIIPEQEEYMKSRVERIRKGTDGNAETSLYVQGRVSMKNPEVSVMWAHDEVIKRFPQTTVVSAEYDFLRIQDEAFAKRLHTVGVKVNTIRYLGCDHGFLDLLGTTVQAEELCMELAEAIRGM
ncbi:MAG: alpha/beta hydrolase [Erysipelotrichaceae bacterium]|nr:alpha/beta hydrolase [Erysipelotrichaceae bacterium]